MSVRAARRVASAQKKHRVIELLAEDRTQAFQLEVAYLSIWVTHELVSDKAKDIFADLKSKGPVLTPQETRS